MKKLTKILAYVLVLTLALCLCACSQPTQTTDGSSTTATTEPTQAPTQSTTQAPTDAVIPDGMVQLKVKVVDEGGNPIVGVMMQVCTDETCLAPVKTDDAGVATFAPAAEGEYHANFLPGVPEGYEAEAEVFYFEAGKTELTIVLKAVA